MATRTLRGLRNHFGRDALIVGIMGPYVVEVLAGNDALSDQIFYDPRSSDPAVRSWSLVAALRRERFDSVVLLTNSLRTGLLAWASGARERIGYARNVRGALLT